MVWSTWSRAAMRATAQMTTLTLRRKAQTSQNQALLEI